MHSSNRLEFGQRRRTRGQLLELSRLWAPLLSQHALIVDAEARTHSSWSRYVRAVLGSGNIWHGPGRVAKTSAAFEECVAETLARDS
jgi:hypothetical protein